MTRYHITSTWLFCTIITVIFFSFMVTACDLSGGGGSTRTTLQSGNVQATPTPAGIRLGVQPCPDSLKDPAHWNSIVHRRPNQQVESVVCGYLMGIPTLQAVVKLRYGGTERLLDIFVYTAIPSVGPTPIFDLKGLLHGDVTISNYNTLMTAQVDPNSSQNKGVPAAQLQQDLYREFKWSDSAGTLVQVTFPGIYPDLTRYQAEFEQRQINTGQGFQQWRLSAVTTAQYLAEFVFMWDPDAPTTVVSGAGTHDANALILVKNPSPGGATIKVSLSRLELNTNGGIWEVTAVETNGMSLTSPQNGQRLASPIKVMGFNTSLAGKIMTIAVLDHERTDIGHATIVEANTTGKTGFSDSIPYVSSFQGGTQEGIITLYTSAGKSAMAAAVMVKVLLSA